MFSLRDYQQDLVSKTFAAWNSGIRKVLLQLSTGGGKTIIFAAIASKMTAQSEGVLVVAHREELILQAAEKLAAVTKLQPGIIKAGYKPNDSLIQVASIQTLSRRETYPKAQLVIIDEAHHSSANSYRKLLDAYPEALILGLTATPRREDGYGLRDVFDHLISSISTKELIALGHLTDYKLIAGFKYSRHKVPLKRDFTRKELEEVASDYKPTEVLKQWQNFCTGQKTVIFAVNVKHSQDITQAFCANGITCEHLDGETSNIERKQILDRFRSGQTQVISNCAILTEGFDCPDSSAAVIARPTSSVTLWLQMIGRVLRPAPGKDYATILDMTDNWFRLGRPCDNRKWSLEPVSCDPDTQGSRCCPYCHHVFKPMPDLIRTKDCFSYEKAEFVIQYEVDCPNCGKSFKWVLEEHSVAEHPKIPMIISDFDIQFKEVPPEVRLFFFTPIIEAKKRKFKNLEKQLAFYNFTIRDWFLNCQELNENELIYAIELLGCSEEIFESSIESLVYRVRYAKEWTDITKIMSERPESIKKLIWSRFSNYEKNKFKNMKADYENEINEIQEWLTEENLALVADYLSDCQDINMISSLCEIYHKLVIKAAIDRVPPDKRNQISQWVAQLKRRTEFRNLYFH
ncbi:DEAD/DEAH box helicase [Nostoc sp. FACHB-87]|uniref:DEAD/DEAH box helicase n=1 Tax=Nostocaceae TaxID=1162 RepID=UPI001686174F|nr:MULTISPECIES: DEAD/DEAH box helicase [Nostocaceae]MBD2459372.1 DEAD/DEAH box helicase [Nostoc sp. FACHB-87]MBD2478342.1 DEAD/DEAH box helicase [Anabaena sp. FACHB-83]